MILHNEFTVRADIETVWRQLLDMEGVASCLPGATVSATDEENTFDGTMRLKIGPMTVEYRGRAKLSEIDAEHHRAVISLSAREAKGQGTAMATVQNELEETAEGTRVRAQTDLNITGPQAQFGRGVIEDVGGRVMNEFSKRLGERIAEPANAGSAGAEPADQASAPAIRQDDVLDVGAYVPPRIVAGAAVLLGLVVLALLLRHRRR